MVISPKIFDLPNWAELSSVARGVFLCLALRADKNRQAFPSIPRMALDMKHDKKTVIAAIKQLEKCGFISRLCTPGKVTKYTIQPVVEMVPVPKEPPVVETVQGSSRNGTTPVPKEPSEQKKNIVNNRKQCFSTCSPWIENATIRKDKDYIKNVMQWLNSASDDFWTKQTENFPGIDIERETQEALNWLKNNPSKRAKYINQFLHRWYQRAVS